MVEMIRQAAVLAVAVMASIANASWPCRDIRFSPLPQGTMLYGDPVHLENGKPFAKDPTVIRHGGRYLMYYSACGGSWHGAIAESTNLVDWVRVDDIEVEGAPFKGGWVAPCVKQFGGKIHLFAQSPVLGAGDEAKRHNRLWHATSDDGIRFRIAPGNPVIAARNDWSIERAIDAEAYRVGDRMMMAFATRERPGGAVQQLGLSWAPYGSDYAADKWTELSVKGPILKPELPWEGHCIEAASVIRRKGIWYMFYAGAYNHERQQIGLAWSADGVNFTRWRDTPVLPHGTEGSWNAWESGHPGVFEDDDGQIYLFYQGKATLEGGYRLSCLRVEFMDDETFSADEMSSALDDRWIVGPEIPSVVSHREMNVDGGAVLEGAEWLWHPDVKTAKGPVTLRTSFDLPMNPRIDRAVLTFSCDNAATVRINGRELAQQSGNLNAWRTLSALKDVRNALRPGLNAIEADCENIADGAAGFISSLDMVVNGKTCRVFTDALAWEASLDRTSFTRAWSAGPYGCEPWKRFDVTGHARRDGKLMPQLQTTMSFSVGKTVPAGRYWLLCDGFERGGLEYGGDVAFDMNGERAGVFVGKPYAAEISRFVRAGNNELCFREVKAQNPRLIHTPPDNGPYDLRCEYQREPLGVVRPRFCWKYAGSRPDKWRMTLRDSDGVVAMHEAADHLFVEPQLKLEPWRRYWWDVDGEIGTFVAGVEKWRMPFFCPGWRRDEREYWVARRRINLYGAESVVVALCSRGSHRLYVNGHPASDGFGPNRSHIEDDVLLAETYDVTHLVRDGENDFSVFVNDGWLRIKTCGEDKTSCLSIDGRAETAGGVVAIDSSEPWVVSRSGDRTIGGHRHSSNYGGGEHLCDKPVESAAQPGVSADSEGFSVSCSIADRDFAVRQIKPVGIVPCDGESSASEQKVWKIDMGEAFTGFMRLRLRGRKGDVARMSVSDNFVERCSFGQEWEYEFCGGDGVFENRLNWMAGRFFYLSGCEKPSPEDVTGIVLTCIGRRTGGFIGDGDIEKVIDMDNDTFIACTLGGVTMDCPHRARLGYGETSLSTMWGDGMPYFDTAAFYSAYLLKWASSQRPDGRIPQVSPDGRGWGGIFWSCYPVYGLADFCRAYPDGRLVEAMRPAIDKWLDFLQGHVKNGLLQLLDARKGYSLGDWAYPETDSSNWGDWGYTREGMFFNNAAYAWAMLRAMDTPSLVDEARRKELLLRHASLAAAIDREWYADGLYVSADARYQAMGLVCGAAEAGGHRAETERALLDIVERKGFIDGGSPSYHVILRALCGSERGRKIALRTLRNHSFPGYLRFADEGFNLLPEHWRYRRDSRGSMMHTCYTGAAGAVAHGFAGFEVDGNNVTVSPLLSDALPDFSAHTETMYGTLAMKVETRGDIRVVKVLCPCGCRGMFEEGGGRHVLRVGLNRFEIPVGIGESVHAEPKM